MTYSSSSRNGATVRLVVVHTGEGILRSIDMARFLDNNPGASAHATCDADTTIAPMVPYDRAAWTLGSGNPISDNIELCAFAAFTREQWLSTGNVISPKGTTVRNPRAIVRRGAQWAAERCRARGIPIRKLTVDQVRAGWSGICGHIDWNLAHNAGDHWDPGPGFPWDVFISDAVGEDDDMTPDEMKYQVLASEWRFDGRNPIDMWRHTVARVDEISAAVAAIAAQLKALSLGGGSVDVPALVDAINDEDDRRDRDGDPKTGQAS